MSRQLRVATYNIHKTVGIDRRRDPERILEILRELDADIIALQEADRRFGTRQSTLPLQKIAQETPWTPVNWGSRPGGIGWHGNAILLRDDMEVRKRERLHLPTLEPRGGVCCEVETQHGPIRIVAVHLDLSGLWRRRQIRRILSYLDRQPRNMPTVIMGDFNQWSNRGALSEFSFHHHRILQTPKSFHTARPIAALDRIVISHDLAPIAMGAHQSELAKRASDHLPIWADIAFA